jgi:hypothetical protein
MHNLWTLWRYFLCYRCRLTATTPACTSYRRLACTLTMQLSWLEYENHVKERLDIMKEAILPFTSTRIKIFWSVATLSRSKFGKHFKFVLFATTLVYQTQLPKPSVRVVPVPSTTRLCVSQTFTHLRRDVIAVMTLKRHKPPTRIHGVTAQQLQPALEHSQIAYLCTLKLTVYAALNVLLASIIRAIALRTQPADVAGTLLNVHRSTRGNTLKDSQPSSYSLPWDSNLPRRLL